MLISKRILGVSLLLLGTAVATAAMAEGRHYPWQKAPGPISGSWSVTCEEMAGMVVEFSVDGNKAGDDGHEARVRDGGERGDARDSIRTLWC
jgi:hypothetical protein